MCVAVVRRAPREATLTRAEWGSRVAGAARDRQAGPGGLLCPRKTTEADVRQEPHKPTPSPSHTRS